ncbi:hypothetical protein ACX818_001383 [Acinetobacter baumannii]
MSKEGAKILKRQKAAEQMEARLRAKRFLELAREMAELAKAEIDKNELFELDFDIYQSGGRTEITWYNSSESC